MQIAGNNCKVCNLKIVIYSEGHYCRYCKTFAHTVCEPGNIWRTCGEPFQQGLPHQPDPRRDAILPRSLRPAVSDAGMLVVGLALLLIMIVLLVYAFSGPCPIF
jgi:hypothetical protein